MEIYFNELSTTDKSSISYEAVQIMAGIYRELKSVCSLTKNI